ncbi:hypothetical protein [Bacillus mojavensis]|uniref:hypothetical protein n=1 Tax=Bacillus mojavensis TaxID=72360 RepID=UPI002DBC5E98|nr:hypothetical protein [Bacillus mojavensis]MEC1666369.1 hypothetical protein [Bacillus mojavensis]
MKKISKVDAFNVMDEIDFKVMDQEVDLVFNSDQRNGREMTQQFFSDDSGDILLELYWENKLVHAVRFKNNKG